MDGRKYRETSEWGDVDETSETDQHSRLGQWRMRRDSDWHLASKLQTRCTASARRVSRCHSVLASRTRRMNMARTLAKNRHGQTDATHTRHDWKGGRVLLTVTCCSSCSSYSCRLSTDCLCLFSFSSFPCSPCCSPCARSPV